MPNIMTGQFTSNSKQQYKRLSKQIFGAENQTYFVSGFGCRVMIPPDAVANMVKKLKIVLMPMRMSFKT